MLMLRQLSFGLSYVAAPPPTRCLTDRAEALMPLPVGSLPGVAVDSGFAAGPTVAGAATTTHSPLQDSTSAEATFEAPMGPRAAPMVWPMTPTKAQRRRRSGSLD